MPSEGPSRSNDPIRQFLAGRGREPIAASDDRPLLVFLCTGNAARSVMAATMMRDALGADSPYIVSSGGTHVLPNQPMSVRTRRALERHGLTDPWHRSHQLDEDDVIRSSLIVAMEPMHLEWMARTHADGVAKTGSLARLARDLAELPSDGDGRPTRTSFDALVDSLGLAGRQFEPWEEIIDPASGEQPVFDECSDAIQEMIGRLHEALMRA